MRIEPDGGVPGDNAERPKRTLAAAGKYGGMPGDFFHALIIANIVSFSYVVPAYLSGFFDHNEARTCRVLRR